MIASIVFAAIVIAVIALLLFLERGRLLRRSTWAVLRASGWQKFRSGTFWHTYVYARFPKEYIGYALKKVLPNYDAAARQSAADHYHGKVLPIALAEALVTHDHALDLPNLE